jgi:hypothetical protein
MKLDLHRIRSQYVIRFDAGCGPPINEAPSWCVWRPGDYYRPGPAWHVLARADTWGAALKAAEDDWCG